MSITRKFIDQVLSGQEPSRTGWNGAEGSETTVDDTNQPQPQAQAQASPFDQIGDPNIRGAFIWEHEQSAARFEAVNQQFHNISDFLTRLHSRVEEIALGKITGKAVVGKAGVGGLLMVVLTVGGALFGWLGFCLLVKSLEHAHEVFYEGGDFVVPWLFYLAGALVGLIAGATIAAQLEKRFLQFEHEMADSDQEVDRPTVEQQQAAPPNSQVA